MASFSASSNKDDGAFSGALADSGLRTFMSIISLGSANKSFNEAKNNYNAYLEDLDIMTDYSNRLSSIEGEKITYENNAFYYEGLIEDLNRQKAESEEWLEDYRQMLAGEGDEDNLLLAQDQYNQQQIENTENELASYKDASILELDSTIQAGLTEFKSRRQAEALQSVYASATGAVVGAHNNAAKQARAAIKAFAGDDMRLNETGAESLSEAGKGAGSYAKMMISMRQTIRDNTNRLQSNVDAARLTFMSFRDEAADAAEENEQFLADYDKTLANYEKNLAYAQQSMQNLQDEAQSILDSANEVMTDINEYEKDRGWEQSSFK